MFLPLSLDLNLHKSFLYLMLSQGVTLSPFFPGKGKVKAWDVQRAYAKTTEAFLFLAGGLKNSKTSICCTVV